MTVNFNQTVRPGASGFPAGFSGQVDWWIGSTHPVNVSAKNASSTDAVITYFHRDGDQTIDTISANTTYEVPALDVVRFNVTGNGAVLALWMGWPESKPPTSLTVLGNVTSIVTGTVSTSIDAQTVGVAPATTLGGAAIDPRNVDLTTDSVGLAKASQLPGALDASGGVKTAVVAPVVTTSHGVVVDVHDQGA